MVPQLLTAITLPVSSVRLEAIAQKTVVTSRCSSAMDVLSGALGNRIIERFAPGPEVLRALAASTPSIDLYVDDVRYIVERTTSDPGSPWRSSSCALRLGATRTLLRP